MRDRYPDLVCKLRQLADFRELGAAGVARQLLLEPLVSGKIHSAVSRHTVIVLAGEDARRKRRPDRGSETQKIVERTIVCFHLLALEYVVLGLLHRWRRDAK